MQKDNNVVSENEFRRIYDCNGKLIKVAKRKVLSDEELDSFYKEIIQNLQLIGYKDTKNTFYFRNEGEEEAIFRVLEKKGKYIIEFFIKESYTKTTGIVLLFNSYFKSFDGGKGTTIDEVGSNTLKEIRCAVNSSLTPEMKDIYCFNMYSLASY